MARYYAQINSENICEGVSQLGDEEVTSSNLVEIEHYDELLIGKMWTGSEWIENPNPPEPQPETVTLEILQAKIDQLEQQNMALMMGMVDVYSAVTTNKGE